MPVTAKLSRKFYETLGDEIANELVTWFNDVDATYRADLRELNELNFARFDAKVEQRFADFDARLERRIAELEVRFEQRLAQTDLKVEQRMAQVEVKLAETKGELIRWMFAFWAPTAAAFLGLAVGVIGLYLKA